MQDSKVIHQFVHAIQSGNIDTIGQCLSDDGEFEIIDLESDDEDPRVEVDKVTFLFWIKDRWKDYQALNGDQEITATYSKCKACNLGYPVVFFNDGTFPHETTNPEEPSKLGYAVEIIAGRIQELSFCLDFENPVCNNLKDLSIQSGSKGK